MGVTPFFIITKAHVVGHAKSSDSKELKTSSARKQNAVLVIDMQYMKMRCSVWWPTPLITALGIKREADL